MPVVGFVGRVTADKGVGALVEALRLLRSRGRAVQLLVLGSQSEHDSDGWVDRLRAEANVVLTGHVDDVRPYLASDRCAPIKCRSRTADTHTSCKRRGARSTGTTPSGGRDTPTE